MPFTVACAQIAPIKADVDANLDKIAECILQAATEGADLVVFPETSTAGYFLEGGVLESSLTEEQLCEGLSRRLVAGARCRVPDAGSQGAKLSGGLDKPIDAVVGFYQQKDGNLYNAAAYIEFKPQPHLLTTYRKFFLPTYGLFDEERFVSRGRELAVFDTRFGKIALLICEDAWHSILPTLCAKKGAQLIIVPAASPGRGFSAEYVENLDRYARLMKAIDEEHGIYCVNCQLCGFEGGKGFVGGSMVVDPFGKLIAQGPLNEEHILLAQVDLDLVQVARVQTPLISDLQSAWGDIKRIVDEE
jgi:N-carbamoylputrescine amidase